MHIAIERRVAMQLSGILFYSSPLSLSQSYESSLETKIEMADVEAPVEEVEPPIVDEPAAAAVADGVVVESSKKKKVRPMFICF